MERLADEAERAGGEAGGTEFDESVRLATDARLHELLDAAGEVRRLVDGVAVLLAAEVAERSRAELGSERLARRHGFRHADELVAVRLGVHPVEAKRITRVGADAAPRTNLVGESLPPRSAAVASALVEGEVGVAAADEIVAFRRRVEPRAHHDALDEAEELLVESAPSLTLRELQRVIAELEARIDPDGAEPRAERHRRNRCLTFGTDADGMVTMRGKFDAATAAPIRLAIDSIVRQQLAARDGGDDESDAPEAPAAGADGGDDETGAPDASAAGAGGGTIPASAGQVSREERPIGMLAADALATLCKHALGCEGDGLPVTATTVVVRMGIDDLRCDAERVLADRARAEEETRTAAARRSTPGPAAAPDDARTGALDEGRVSASRSVPREWPVSRPAPAAASGLTGVPRRSSERPVFLPTAPESPAPEPDSSTPGLHPPAFEPHSPTLEPRPPALEPLARIDGLGPIDAATARRLAASAEIIPAVLGGDGEVLDLGRRIRLFTRAQRIALVERDGGCAFCGLPPHLTEAHHILWWVEHRGTTDLCNGVLLCTTCHHRVHEGWEVRIVPDPERATGALGGGTVWFIPPSSIDLDRRPRLGGRKRFDPVFHAAHPPIPPPTESVAAGP